MKMADKGWNVGVPDGCNLLGASFDLSEIKKKSCLLLEIKREEWQKFAMKVYGIAALELHNELNC